MKRLILASVLCLAFAFVLRAQEKTHVLPPVQLIDPAHPFGNWDGNRDGNWGTLWQGPKVQPRRLVLSAKIPQSGVCSVPLLDAHAGANDPGIARTLKDGSAPIRKANVPAPPCEKK